MDRVANLDLLRTALERRPRAVVGVASDGRRVLVLERLSDDTRVLTKFGLALRWLGERQAAASVLPVGRVERVCAGVWLVPELGEIGAELSAGIVAGVGEAPVAAGPAAVLGFSG